MAEIKIAGHSYKRWQVAAVAIGGGGIGIYIYLRRKQAAASGSSTATGTDPVTGLPYSEDSMIDPLTGQSYLAEAQQYGSVSAAEAALSSGAYQGGGLGGASTSYGPVGSYGTTLGVTSGSGYATNADWAQAVESGLTGIGYTATDTAAAVGRYLGGLSLTPDQANIVQVALAEFGPPPSGSYSIIAAPATGTATSGDAGSTTAGTSGGSTGTGASGSGSTDAGSTGGSSSGGGGTSSISYAYTISNAGGNVEIGWEPVGPATSWNVTRTGPGGTVTNHVSGSPRAYYENLARGHNFEIRIQPLPTGSVGGYDFKTN